MRRFSTQRKVSVVLLCVVALAVILYGIANRHFYYPYGISAGLLFIAGLIMFTYKYLETALVSGVMLFAYAFMPFFFAETPWIPDVFGNEYLKFLIVIASVLVIEGIALITYSIVKMGKQAKHPKKTSSVQSEMTDEVRKAMQSYNNKNE
jgi:hypothetical protein